MAAGVFNPTGVFARVENVVGSPQDAEETIGAIIGLVDISSPPGPRIHAKSNAIIACADTSLPSSAIFTAVVQTANLCVECVRKNDAASVERVNNALEITKVIPIPRLGKKVLHHQFEQLVHDEVTGNSTVLRYAIGMHPLQSALQRFFKSFLSPADDNPFSVY